MTKFLEVAISKLRTLPSERQDEAAELILSVVEHDPETAQLKPEQVAEVERRLREPAEYAAHAEVRTFFQKHAI